MRWYNFLSYVLILILFITLFFIGMILKNQGLKIKELERDNQKIRQELIETEAKCERMTDTCIHILSEGVWE
jgi:hypothetical protein